jgi:two-component sensor histidine kinase
VRDNGVGMSSIAPVRTGMGTSIVQALARQLGAVVEISPRHPGTQVSIQHTRVALVHEDPRTARDDDAGAQRAEERS